MDEPAMAEPANPRDEPRDEIEELDPATERVRRRLIRLMAVSIGIMLIGVVGVFAAVVMRTSESPPAPDGEGGAHTIALPANVRILESSLSDDAILLRVSQAEGEMLYLISRSNGRVTDRFRLERGVDGQSPPPSGATEARP